MIGDIPKARLEKSLVNEVFISPVFGRNALRGMAQQHEDELVAEGSGMRAAGCKNLQAPSRSE